MVCSRGPGEGPAHSCSACPGRGHSPFSLPPRDTLRQVLPWEVDCRLGWELGPDGGALGPPGPDRGMTHLQIIVGSWASRTGP